MSKPGAIITQPGANNANIAAGGQWMARPDMIPSNCPPGLEYLTQIDQLVCRQMIELLQAFTGFETKNKYVIANAMDQQVFFAFEETDCCMRYCCGAQREFTLHIVDNQQREVMRVYRPLKFCAGNIWCASMCDCCSQEIQVEAPPGTVIGRVRQTGSCGACNHTFDIFDEHDTKVLEIEGPCCCMLLKCCGDVPFKVLSNGHEIGTISKQWAGVAQECCTTATNFGIQFPLDLDVKLKATLMGVMFLIDFMVWERQQQ